LFRKLNAVKWISCVEWTPFVSANFISDASSILHCSVIITSSHFTNSSSYSFAAVQSDINLTEITSSLTMEGSKHFL
jgi:hypothetical protein